MSEYFKSFVSGVILSFVGLLLLFTYVTTLNIYNQIQLTENKIIEACTSPIMEHYKATSVTHSKSDEESLKLSYPERKPKE